MYVISLLLSKKSIIQLTVLRTWRRISCLKVLINIQINIKKFSIRPLENLNRNIWWTQDLWVFSIWNLLLFQGATTLWAFSNNESGFTSFEYVKIYKLLYWIPRMTPCRNQHNKAAHILCLHVFMISFRQLFCPLSCVFQTSSLVPNLIGLLIIL